MKRLTIFCFFLLAFYKANSQKSDYNWLSGYDSNVIIDSATYGFRYVNTLLNFNFNPVHVTYDSLSINFTRTNTSFSDDNGDLLFSTNGIYIMNASNQLVAGSYGMNAGWLDEVWDPNIQHYGYRSDQGVLAFRDISNPLRFFLLHSFIDSVPGSSGQAIYVPQILSSYVDMSANGGLGNTIYINKSVVDGNLGNALAATRHGNGRDWWILVQKRNTNCFYRILLADTGFAIQANLTCAGELVSDSDYTAVCFSPDGSKFAQFAEIGGVDIYDFDRCSGELSNPFHYPLDIWTDSAWLGVGVSFSPNSRFLYVAATKVVLQFDTWATDIAASLDTIGVFDGFALPFGSYFFNEQLAPDGKIYISCGNTEADYHVINNPDLKNDSCNFAQHGLRLPTPSGSVPNFPNYRLGALSGSACDTLTGLGENERAQKEKVIRVFPNPASNFVMIDYGFTDWNKGEVSLEITNQLGQTVYEQTLPMYSGFQKLDISNYPSGVYNAFIMRGSSPNGGKGAVVAVAKWVKE
jgi:hypothetical protein